jgi:plasmid maintenance system antidote protein VapI
MKPPNPIRPGTMLLEEFLLPAGRTQREVAAKLGPAEGRAAAVAGVVNRAPQR